MKAPLLPWHQNQWAQVQRSMAQGRIPHALLLSGAHGLGKALFADGLARALVCEQPLADVPGCGQCRGCHLFDVGTHPDVHRVGPAPDSNWIRVDQIRLLCETLGLHAARHGRKVAILAPAEAMNVPAANSLLKTLEEPTPDTVMLLVSAHPARLPATIRSRCQSLPFQAPHAEVARAWLTAQVADQDPELLLAVCYGAPLAALSFARGEGPVQREALFRDLEYLIAGRTDAVALAPRWAKIGLDFCVRVLQGWTIDMIRLKMATHPPRLINPDRSDSLAALARQIETPELFARLAHLQELGRLIGTSINVEIALEGILVVWEGSVGSQGRLGS